MAPGVTTVVAVDQEAVVGFAEVFSDGEIQAFLANVAVDEAHRGKGSAVRWWWRRCAWLAPSVSIF